MNESIEIKATPHIDGNIVVTTEFVKEPGTRNEEREMIERRILHTQDQEIQKGLIALGWTPPDGEAPIVADAAMLIDAIIGKGFASDIQRDAGLKAGYVRFTPTLEYRWDREALSLLSVRKLLGIYTDGSLNG